MDALASASTVNPQRLTCRSQVTTCPPGSESTTDQLSLLGSTWLPPRTVPLGPFKTQPTASGLDPENTMIDTVFPSPTTREGYSEVVQHPPVGQGS